MTAEQMSLWIREHITKNLTRLNDEQRQNLQLAAQMLVAQERELQELRPLKVNP